MDTSETTSGTPVITSDFVLPKCEYFVNVQLWPTEQQLNPLNWLQNFLPEERDYALHLLNAFLFFSEPLSKQLFFAAFQALSMPVVLGKRPARARADWESFLDSVLITRVTGETPSDADSGYIFSRLARQELGLLEDQILEPKIAAERILRQRSGRVVFLDDFLGSGRQLIATWNRAMLTHGTDISFKALARAFSDVEFYYCPLICTEDGLKNVGRECPEIHVTSGHLLPDTYNALHPNSVIWPPQLLREGAAFIEQASKRAGIPDNQWRGFQGLGLTLAFYHCIPDATLPIFYWNQNNWRPLMERK